MRVAAAQISCSLGDLEANITKIEQFTERGRSAGAELVVFPEMSDTGYAMETIRAQAQAWTSGAVPRLQKCAARLSIAIICGVSQREKDRIYNSQVVIGHDGQILAQYRKTHLFKPAPIAEHTCFAPGDRLVDLPLGDFRAGKTDILVGTQMIAKGLHFPNVTLVGIIYADLALHQPDFRAGERTFQLLTQVAGRAGRGDVEGEVFVQAFTPSHPAIQYARRHDFTGFYEQEIEFREQLKYPPASRVALLTLRGRNEDKVKFSAEHLKREIEFKVQGSNFKVATGEATLNLKPETLNLIISGPAPAPLLRAEQFYRYQIMLRTRAMSKLSQTLAKIIETLALPEDVTLAVDIDPVDLG